MREPRELVEHEPDHLVGSFVAGLGGGDHEGRAAAVVEQAAGAVAETAANPYLLRQEALEAGAEPGIGDAQRDPGRVAAADCRDAGKHGRLAGAGDIHDQYLRRGRVSHGKAPAPAPATGSRASRRTAGRRANRTSSGVSAPVATKVAPRGDQRRGRSEDVVAGDVGQDAAVGIRP